MSDVSEAEAAKTRYARLILWGVACSLLFANWLFYRLAPCSVFNGWSLPAPFYLIVWPLIFPAIVVLAVLSHRSLGKDGLSKWHWLAWFLVAAAIAYAWIDGYLTTYLWWERNPDAPWLAFC